MFKQISTQTYNWILIIGVILFLFEIVFFFGGAIVPALFAAIFTYVGWKYLSTLWGKILFWISLISFIFSVLNLMAIRFFVLAAVVILLINYTKATKNVKYENPELPAESRLAEDLVRKDPLFDHRIFDEQRTSEYAYQWRDVNTHGLMGDRIIDLSNTVLPNDTAIISIRHGIGNIEIYVPYEVEVSIHHSAIFGRAEIFNRADEKLFNQSVFYQTKNYDHATTRVKIVTSLLSGDIEVKRI